MGKHGCCVDRDLGYGEGCTPQNCMELPDGKTCGDCVHCKKCCSMFGHEPEYTYCDWFPRRFVEVTNG